jgi:hypothetical protein
METNFKPIQDDIRTVLSDAEINAMILTIVEEILLFGKSLTVNKKSNHNNTVASITLKMIEIKRTRDFQLNKIHKFKQVIYSNLSNVPLIAEENIYKLETMEEIVSTNYITNQKNLEEQLDSMRDSENINYIMFILPIIFGFIIYILSL